MKKAIVLGTVTLAMGLISCRKCKTCTTYTSVEETGSSTITTSTSVDYCGKDYDDAPVDATVITEDQGTTTTVEIKCTEK